MSELARLEVAEGIGTIRLDRPKMNALNIALQNDIRACAEEAADRDDVKAVVVYGGEKVFAAGADIKEMQPMSYGDMAKAVGGLHAYVTAVSRIPKPTVAAITGYALGGGCELALSCDFRVCGESAQLGQPEVLLGVIPGMGGTQRLARLVGPTRAKDLCFSGRFVKSDEALRIGLVDKVVPDDQVYAASVAWMRSFAGGASMAIAAMKDAIDRGSEMDLESGLALERSLFTGMFATEDRSIGMTSFMEHGPGKASFTGR
ncbi:MAG: enoyl-CoA hydratase [Actinomycetales bacterium]|nr:MAG: enoyl-CoA hydratase [Actinomycetales bacterium]